VQASRHARLGARLSLERRSVRLKLCPVFGQTQPI
jgi:hypothetical protein